jgi:quercetin dioxygenase-like cupin family protein
MNTKGKWITAFAVLAAAVLVAVGNVAATPATGVTTTILAKTTVSDLDLTGRTLVQMHDERDRVAPWIASVKTLGASDLYVVDNKIAPGGDTGWHSHPGPSIVFVVAGTVTNYSSDDPACSPHVYGAGSSFVDAGGSDVHLVRNEGTVEAETIAVQFLPAGATRRMDMPEPPNCHL